MGRSVKTALICGALLSASLGCLGFAIVCSMSNSSDPKIPTLQHVNTIGSSWTTNGPLDCYGDELGLTHVLEARMNGEPRAAEGVRIDEMARSQGITLDADQRFMVVLTTQSSSLPLLKLRIRGGTFDRFECWSYARDAQEVAQ